MENSNEKPKKKKFSFFCCFSTNEGGKKRKKKYNSISNSNKTNISSSEQNNNIKVKDFSIEENTYISKKVNNIPIGNNSKTNSITNIKEDIKEIDKIKQQKNETIQNIKINLGDNKLKKFHTLDNIMTHTNNNYNILRSNKEDTDNKNIYLKLSTYNINNNCKVNINIHENNLQKSKNNNYFLDKSDLIDNNLFANEEENNYEIKNDNENYLVENISNNNNSIKKINFDESLSIIEKIKQKSITKIQEIDDTVNIYGNNSFNRTIRLDEVKIKKKEKENINYNTKIKNIEQKKYNSINSNLKNRTDSMIFYNDDHNKDFNILEKPNKNSSICLPNYYIKLDLSKILIDNKKENNNINNTNIDKIVVDDEISEKTDELNYIKKSHKKISSFPKNIKKIINWNSYKLLNYVKIEKLGKEIDYNIKTGRYSLYNFENNKIIYDFKFDKKNTIISHNTYQGQNKDKYNNNFIIDLDKEKTISLISQKNKMNTNAAKTISNKNIINNQINLNNIDIIPTIENENNLNYINKEKYFENYSNKEENNSKISEKFIIENANSKAEEEDLKENTENKNRDVDNENKISKNNASKVSIKLEEEKKKIKEAEENIKDFEAEIEDEQDSLDEESHKINDSKSIISNYIVAPLTGIQDLKSYAPSLYSEFKDNISNVNDLISNKEGGFSFPPGANETEIEIMNENGKGFKSFIETPRASGTYNKRFTHKNINYNTTNTNTQIKYSNSSNKSMNQKIKNICDKINRNTNEIQKMNEKIINLEEKIKTQEEYNKKYELWIEKEEEESELLINMLNFLNNQRK